jgi:hypothetical protein
VISPAETIARELHRALRVVVEARYRLTDMPAPVREWIDLSTDRRRIAIEVVETLLANGTIAVGPGRPDDVIANRVVPSTKH